MPHTFTAEDRSALIRLASTLPAGSEVRRVILAEVPKMQVSGHTTKTASVKSSLDSLTKEAKRIRKKAKEDMRNALTDTRAAESAAKGYFKQKYPGITVDSLEIKYHQYYKKASWHLEGSFLIDPSMDDDDAWAAFEGLGGYFPGYGPEKEPYSSSLPRRWTIATATKNGFVFDARAVAVV